MGYCKDFSDCPKGKKLCCANCPDVSECDGACDIYYSKEIGKETECPNYLKCQEELATVENNTFAVQIARLEVQKKSIDAEEKKLKDSLLTNMTKFGINKIENEDVKITLTKGGTRTSIDTNKLKNDGLYDRYSKQTISSPYVIIKLKE